MKAIPSPPSPPCRRRSPSRRSALIKVDYKVLPHVIDVAEAMKPDAPLLHDHLLTEGANPPADQAVEHRQAHRVQQGRHRGGLQPGRGRDRARLHHAGRAPGLYRAARRAGVSRRRRPGPGLVDDPGPLPGARLLRRLLNIDTSQIRVTPTEIGGGFGGKTVVYLEPLAIRLSQKSGKPVKMTDDARGGVPRLRPGAGRQRQGQDRRHEGRPHRRRRMHGRDAGGRLPGLAGRAGLHVQLRLLRHRQRLHRGLRRRQQPAQGRGLSRARRADLGVGGRVDDRHPGAAAQAWIRSTCA